MRSQLSPSTLVLTTLLTVAAGNSLAIAQVIPDNTLGSENSLVTPNVTIRGNQADLIEGGAIRGSNLFHSFLELNVDAGQQLYFANPEGIATILSRVTGSNPSNIFGTLGVNGSAGLFLINPNGIAFGPEASLDIAGSFYASTAEAIPLGDEVFSAVQPEQSKLLSVSPSTLFVNYLSNSGTLSNQGNLAAGKNLTLAANRLELQGQIASQDNLLLLAGDTLQIGDSTDAPFVALAGGDLLVQGNEQVDIVALSHPDSGLYSYGNITVRSANSVSGDARYWSGGTFRVEQLTGELGTFSSPGAPIIRVSGDLLLGNYIGTSLHILAGGSVFIPGTVAILDSSAAPTSISENLTLSDGTPLSVNGSAGPTLDIRAGVDLAAVGSPISNLGFAPPVGDETVSSTPSGAAILVGSVVIIPPEGQVLLTNQYKANTTIEGPTDVVVGNFIADKTDSVQGIDARGFEGNGSSVIIDSRGNIFLGENASINTSSASDTAGSITLIAAEDISILASFNSEILALSNNRGGDIKLVSGDDVVLNTGNSILTSSGGSIQVEANKLIMNQLSAIGAPVNSTVDGGDIVLRVSDFIYVNGGNIATFVLALPDVDLQAEFGDTGNIIIETKELEVIGFSVPISGGFLTGGDITSDVRGRANAGDITVSASQIRLLDGGQIRAATSGAGDAGNITVYASDLIEISGIEPQLDSPSTIEVTTNAAATGKAGSLLVNSDRLVISNGGRIEAGVFGEGQGGSLTVDVGSSIEIFDGVENTNPTGLFAGPEGNKATGRGSDVTVRTSRLDIAGDDSQIQSEVDALAAGDAGNIVIEVDELSLKNNASISSATFGAGQGGRLAVFASGQVLLENGYISSEVGESANGSGGDIFIEAGELSLTDRSQISAESNRVLSSNKNIAQAANEMRGDAGSIFISVDDLLLVRDSDITTQSTAFSGGTITIEAGNIRLFGDGDIQTSVQSGTGGGGNINLKANAIIAFDDSDILAAAREGRGGDIILQTSGFFGENFVRASLTDRPDNLDNNDRVDINASGAVNGVVSIPDISFIENSLADLADDIVNTEAFTAGSCIARSNAEGSFVVSGLGGVPERPGNDIPSLFSTGTVRTIEQHSVQTDEAQLTVAIEEPDGLYQLADGRLVLSRACQ